MRTRTLLAAAVAAPLLAGLGFAFLPTPAAASATPAPVAAAAETYSVDTAHSHIQFRTTHMGVSYAHGRFNDFTGDFALGDAPSVRLEVQAASIDTAVDKRDDHLRSPDFFNAKQFPKITFASTKIEKQGEDAYSVTGDLTLLGKTKEVSFEAKKIGEGERGRAGYLAGVHASFPIRRSDFGMTYGIENGGVGDEVLLEISLEGGRESDE